MTADWAAGLRTTAACAEATPFQTSVDLTAHIVRAGLSYKFGGPVVARY